MVQESLPDGYRGRVFAVYDVFYNSARVLAAAISLVLFPALGTSWSVAAVGVVFLAWAPVLPRWIGGTPEIRLLFAERDRVRERPVAMAWGGVEEPVEVVRAWSERVEDRRRVCLRLALRDGSILDVSRGERADQWRIDRERG
jgi:MFS family permease